MEDKNVKSVGKEKDQYYFLMTLITQSKKNRFFRNTKLANGEKGTILGSKGTSQKGTKVYKNICTRSII